MTTFVNLKTRAASRFRDTSNNIYSVAEWADYLNDVYRKVWSFRPDWPFAEALSTSVSLAVSSQTANLPTDTFQVHSVWNSTDDYLLRPASNREAHLFEYQPDVDIGFPERYRVRNTVIEVYPMSDHAVTLRVEYVGGFTALSADGDEPVFPEQFHHLLVEGALALAYEDDGNADLHDRHWAKFEAAVQEMYAYLTMFRVSAYPEIQDTFFSDTMGN